MRTAQREAHVGRAVECFSFGTKHGLNDCNATSILFLNNPVRGIMFDRLDEKGFEITTLHHAEAILWHDMEQAVEEIEDVLLNISLPIDELVRGGGGEGKLTQRLRNALADTYGWKKHCFEIKKTVDGEEKESTSHEVDHVKKFEKGTFALEIEWNNKDPFFDRDLENFKRLHADGVISIGGIITR